MKIEVYTDGGAVPNPGFGGWAAIFVVDGLEKKRISGYAKGVSNNAMEITAVLRAVETFTRPAEFTIYSDSQYVIRSITEWIPVRGLKGKANADLFRQLIKACEPHKITWIWVRGHNGNRFNEMADRAASKQIFQETKCPACGFGIGGEDVKFDWVKRIITCHFCATDISMDSL